jgi:hypothetical protein
MSYVCPVPVRRQEPIPVLEPLTLRAHRIIAYLDGKPFVDQLFLCDNNYEIFNMFISKHCKKCKYELCFMCLITLRRLLRRKYLRW